ncbi:MAG: GNAT family N-acetyltransferase [Chloroflexi bacterium]|nr:GNAT family N-acetyltransferase [Chloroflexota bacterium]MBI1854605.1 GNAT family N-acetyltransferase [Chloroflexota bacterium]MBI3339137.1 GNAT family N-acetyltransferase [Chloroflexota bacterium]
MSATTLMTDNVITLRPLRADDITSMYEAVCESIADLKPWMSWAHDNYQQKETRDWITLAQARWNDGSYFGFAITDAQTQTFLGGCSLSQIHPLYQFCNLGYWIRSTQRGHGYAGRATLLGARFAFERLKLIRVEIVIAADNTASQKVADKIGAHREGILHNRLMKGATVYDAVMYSLLPSDFGLAARL